MGRIIPYILWKIKFIFQTTNHQSEHVWGLCMKTVGNVTNNHWCIMDYQPFIVSCFCYARYMALYWQKEIRIHILLSITPCLMVYTLYIKMVMFPWGWCVRLWHCFNQKITRIMDSHAIYPLVMTNSSPWKNPPFLSSVNHLFLWAMAYHGYVSHNQMVLYQSRHQKNWANQQTPETFFTPVFWMWNIFVQPGTTVADPVNKTAGFVEFADNRGFDSAMRMREETGGAMVKNGDFPWRTVSHNQRVDVYMIFWWWN